MDSSGDGCQDKYTPTAGADTNGWLQMTFTPSNTAEINYCSPSFDITDVRSVVLRISKPTEGDQAIDFNIDDISW